ncbi:MAG: site-specific integrase, partial [Clostridiales bacterium]|nr:site-specific integrase [Clostridiales bacterium]
MVSGLRIGELLALSWKNVDLESGIIKVRATLARLKDRSPNPEKKNKYIVENTTKTASGRRQIPIPKAAVKTLEEHKKQQDEEKKTSKGLYEDNDLVFCTVLGNRLIPRNVARSFVRLAKKADIEGVSVHTLRHTYA